MFSTSVSSNRGAVVNVCNGVNAEFTPVPHPERTLNSYAVALIKLDNTTVVLAVVMFVHEVTPTFRYWNRKFTEEQAVDQVIVAEVLVKFVTVGFIGAVQTCVLPFLFSSLNFDCWRNKQQPENYEWYLQQAL